MTRLRRAHNRPSSAVPLAAAALVLVGLLAVLTFSRYRPIGTAGPTASGDCQSGIAFEGQTYNFTAGSKLLHVDLKTSPTAGRELSERFQIYLNEAASLCDLHRAGRIDTPTYLDRRARLSTQFGHLVSLANAANAAPPKETDQQFVTETLDALRKDGAEEKTRFELRVLSGGRPLHSGDSLRSGDRFSMEIDVATSSWLYVVVKDSSDRVSRVYPSRLTGAENPVSGHIRIPRDPSEEFQLDDTPGVEQLMVFVYAARSDAIERTIRELKGDGSGDNATRPDGHHGEVARALGRAIDTRNIFVVKSETPSGNEVESSIGQAATSFLIDHRK